MFLFSCCMAFSHLLMNVTKVARAVSSSEFQSFCLSPKVLRASFHFVVPFHSHYKRLLDAILQSGECETYSMSQ